MEVLLAEWGTEILLAVIIAGITGYFKWRAKEKNNQLKHYQQLIEQQDAQEVEDAIEEHLKPIYVALAEIKNSQEELTKKHDTDKQSLDDNFDLIIASYRYRLVQLCKDLLNQGFMYEYQYEHLSEFYTLYTKLGGNGQAQDYYNKVTRKLEIRPNPDTQIS